MMKYQTIMLCMALMTGAGAAVMGTAGAVAGRETVAAANNLTASGVIRSLDSKARTFVMAITGDEGGETLTLKIDDKTVYTLDGKPSTMDAALIAGHHATVTYRDQLASRVDAATS